MTRTMLSLLLIASFGFVLTLQSALLIKTSSQIPGLKDSYFMNCSQLTTTLKNYYKQSPSQAPNTVYVFNVTIGNLKNQNYVLEYVRDMKSVKSVFANSPKGFYTAYFQYNRTSEIVDSILLGLQSVAGHVGSNVSTFEAFQKNLTKRGKASKTGVEIVNVELDDIFALDAFLIRAERLLSEKANGKFITAVTFDWNKVENRRILQDADNGAAANNDAAANANNQGTMSISSSTFTGVIVGLFVLAVTLIAMNLLSDIKTPGSFVATPLNIGKEH